MLESHHTWVDTWYVLNSLLVFISKPRSRPRLNIAPIVHHKHLTLVIAIVINYLKISNNHKILCLNFQLCLWWFTTPKKYINIALMRRIYKSEDKSYFFFLNFQRKNNSIRKVAWAEPQWRQNNKKKIWNYFINISKLMYYSI
jgi:hypothetical protein